jgi:hypothetical protein
MMVGPTITFLGVARGDGQITAPIGTTPDGTKIYRRLVGFGFFLVIEAKPGPTNRPVGTNTFSEVPGEFANLALLVSNPLGTGSPAVCDNGPDPPIGGVPATSPAIFSPAAANASNDLTCRYEARTTNDTACTRNSSQESAFANSQTRVQFCPFVGIGSEIVFPLGDTRVTARVTDTLNQPGQPVSIIIRVQPP